MKNDYKLILGLTVILLLSGLAWWLKVPPSPPAAPVQSKNTISPTPAATATGKSSQPAEASAAPSQPNTTPGGNAAAQRKFVNMSVHEVNVILDKIKKGDFDSIMRAWLDAGHVENDRVKQDSIVTLWGYAMRQRTVPPEVFEKMKAIMADPSYSIHERGDMIGVLAEAVTPEAAKLLIYEATTQTDAEVKRMATVALSALGNTYNEANAPLLEPLWKGSNDPEMMKSVAKAMGRIAKASSVELLFNAMLADPTGGPDDSRGQAAYDGLREVHTDNAIPPLAAAMEKNPAGSPANKLALDILGQIADKPASQAVMKWLQASDSSAAPLATDWITQARGTEQLKAAQAALDPSVPFRSEANREALRKGLDAYRANHTTGP